MNDVLVGLLAELEHFGKQTDLNAAHRHEKMLNITHDTGIFLARLLDSIHATRVLEIGTSNGYSTLWLAHAMSKIGGTVTTVERSPEKINMAKTNFERSGLASHIIQVEADASALLVDVSDDAFDMIFLDAERSLYLDWWPHLRRGVRSGGILVVDNANSHAQEMQAFMSAVEADRAFATKLVDIGHGQFMAIRTR